MEMCLEAYVSWAGFGIKLLAGKGRRHASQQACFSAGEAITSAVELNNMCSSSCTHAWNRLYRGAAVQSIHVGAGGYLFMAFLEAFCRL
jgi:hypothetical protein